MRIDGNGKVGIGLGGSQAGAKLHIKGDAGTNHLWIEESTHSNSRTWMVSNARGSVGYGDLGFYVGSSQGGDPSSTAKIVFTEEGGATFAGNVTVDSDTMLVDSAGHGYCVVDAGSTSYATWVAHKMGGTTKYLVGMEGGASAQYRIYDSGDSSVAVHITTTGNSWVADSDERMKKDITSMENRLDDLLKIKVRRFKWKHNDKVDFGFVAQELETCAPDAVEVGSDEVYSKEEAEDSLTAVEGALKNPYGVSREQLIPMMVKSIQELSDKLDTANAKITALENA